MSVISLAPAGRMTPEVYRRERADLRAIYGNSKPEAGARSDQALAQFFRRSQWTQEELAAEEHKSRQWIDFHLRFGRFLEFATTVANREKAEIPLKVLTERRFRGYWTRTHSDDNDRQRFAQVLLLMDEEATLSRSHKQKKPIGEAIKQTCGNGEWHRFTTVVGKVQAIEAEATDADVRAVLNGMVQHGWYDVFCEKKRGGDTYRIVIGGKQKIDLAVLMHELGPILKGLQAEGRKNMATMSPGTVQHLTFQLEQVLQKLTHQSPKDRADGEE